MIIAWGLLKSKALWSLKMSQIDQWCHLITNIEVQYFVWKLMVIFLHLLKIICYWFRIFNYNSVILYFALKIRFNFSSFIWYYIHFNVFNMILYISGKRAALYLSTILRRKVTVLKLVITSLLLMYFWCTKTCPYFVERHNVFLINYQNTKTLMKTSKKDIWAIM